MTDETKIKNKSQAEIKPEVKTAEMPVDEKRVNKICPQCKKQKLCPEKRKERCTRCNKLFLTMDEFEFQLKNVTASHMGDDDNLLEKHNKAKIAALKER